MVTTPGDIAADMDGVARGPESRAGVRELALEVAAGEADRSGSS